jgi:hypothetical protein
MDKSLAIQNAQRHAFDTLAKSVLPNGKPNPIYVSPDNITIPSILAQEQPVTTASNVLTFDFSVNAPAASATLNNVTLPQNNIAVIYGITFLLGVGATANNRQYYTSGLIAGDNVVYTGSILSYKFEQSTLIQNVNMGSFQYQNGTEYNPYAATMLINPLRILSGRLGINQVQITMPSVAGLAFTPNLYARLQLETCIGQASATK